MVCVVMSMQNGDDVAEADVATGRRSERASAAPPTCQDSFVEAIRAPPASVQPTEPLSKPPEGARKYELVSPKTPNGVDSACVGHAALASDGTTSGAAVAARTRPETSRARLAMRRREGRGE